MEKLRDILMEMGLSEKEAIIYLCILKTGICSLTDVSELSGIKRTTLYGYLDMLLQKGFISKIIRSKRILYGAENPEGILKELNKKRETFSRYLPTIMQLYNQSGSKPTTAVYEGITGIRKIYKEIQEVFSPIYAVVSPKKFMASIKLEDRLDFLANIRKNENTIYNLVENNPEGKKFEKQFSGNPMKLRFLPKDFELSVDVLVYGDKVAMISFDNLNGIVVHNREIADFMKRLHQLVWESMKV